MKSPGGEIVQVQGSHIMRSTGRKDRHSKVHTAKGPRDRRVRLSAHTAIQFYDVQDRLGYDRPSKAVDWLIKKANSAIEKLAELPPLNPTPASDDPPDPTPGPPDPEAQPGIDQPEPPGGYGQFGGLSFFPAASESDHHNGLQTYQPPENPSAAADHLGLSLQSLYQAPAAPEQALFGFGPYHRVGELHGQDQAAGGGSGGFGAAAFNQRGTLQSSSSFSQHVRAWDDLPAAASSAQRPHHQIHPHQSLSSSIFGTRFFSDAGGGGFPVFYIPATIHGEDEGHGFMLERPSSSSSHPNSTHR